MSGRHNFVVLDNCMSLELAAYFGGARLVTSVECGLSSRADDMDVIEQASQRRALLVSSDRGLLEKCRQYQAQRRTCLWGLLILPVGIESQRRILQDLKLNRRKIAHPKIDRPVTWKDVREDNLAVVARIEGNPLVTDLCECEWGE
jgi:hypothetical protein